MNCGVYKFGSELRMGTYFEAFLDETEILTTLKTLGLRTHGGRGRAGSGGGVRSNGCSSSSSQACSFSGCILLSYFLSSSTATYDYFRIRDSDVTYCYGIVLTLDK